MTMKTTPMKTMATPMRPVITSLLSRLTVKMITQMSTAVVIEGTRIVDHAGTRVLHHEGNEDGGRVGVECKDDRGSDDEMAVSNGVTEVAVVKGEDIADTMVSEVATVKGEDVADTMVSSGITEAIGVAEIMAAKVAIGIAETTVVDGDDIDG
jgi:hypothetical protein